MARTAAAVKENPQVAAASQQLALTPANGKAVASATSERPRSVLFDMADRFGMEPAAFEAVLRNTVVPGNCSREQFAAFLLVAKEHELNPLLKEIYAFPSKGGGIQPIVGVDGWANLVNSHPCFDGMEFDDKLDSSNNLLAITCKMFRKDRSHPTAATEYMAECKRPTEPWTKWPRRMLRHKAMIQAARYAFGFAGIVDPDEVERFAAETARDVTPRRIASTAAAFDEFGRVEGDGIDFEDDAPAQPEDQPQQQPQETPAPTPAVEKPEPPPEAIKEAAKTEEPGAWPAKQQPTNAEEYKRYTSAHLAAETDGTAIAGWFKSAPERDLRTACGVTTPTFDAVKAEAMKRIAALAEG